MSRRDGPLMVDLALLWGVEPCLVRDEDFLRGVRLLAMRKLDAFSKLRAPTL